MINDEMHEVINKFLTDSGYSRRKFAATAGINTGTFQNLLTRKSKIRYDTALQIANAMWRLTQEQRIKNGRYFLLRARLEEFVDLCMDEYANWRSFASILGLSDEQYRSKLPQKFENKEDECKFLDDLGSLIFLCRKLNDEGRKIAFERLEELTEIPRYQKKDAATPEEGNDHAETKEQP